MRSRAAKAVAMVAFAVGGLVAGGRDAAARPCVPAAHITGDEQLVRDLAAALTARSVEVEERSPCGVVTARVTQGDAHLVVTVTDADGRRAQRAADDVEVAATIVESWLRRDLAAPLLAARPAPRLPEPAGAPARPALTAGRSADRRGIDLGSGLDLGYGVDGSLWSGARVQGCVTLGRVCVGVLVRYAVDIERGGAADEYDSERRMLDTLLTAGVPLHRGRWSLIPGVAIGETRVSAEKDISAFDPEEDDIEESATALRLRVHVGAAYRFAGAWLLRVDAAAGVAALSEGDFLADDVSEDPWESMAGMPRLHTWVGVGIGYEGL